MNKTKYSSELKQRAVAMVAEAVGEQGSRKAAMTHLANLLGVPAGTVKTWVYQGVEPGSGGSPAVKEESVEIRKLKREIAELKRANEILKAASVFSRRNSTPTAPDD